MKLPLRSSLAVGSPPFGVPRGSSATNSRRNCRRGRQPGCDPRWLAPKWSRRHCDWPHSTTRRWPHPDIRLGRPDRNCSFHSRIGGSVASRYRHRRRRIAARQRRRSCIPLDIIMVPPPAQAPAMAMNGVAAARPAWGDADNISTANPAKPNLFLEIMFVSRFGFLPIWFCS